MNLFKNVLIVGAHFDDSELGVGGTAAKLAKQGCNVFKITLTDNVTDFLPRKVSVGYLSSKEQSHMASKVLGIQEIEFAPVECSRLIYSKDLMQKIEKIIFDYSIDTVFMHFSSDMNRDHIEANKLCLTAARHCANIFEYQSNGYILDDAFYPTFFINISDYIDLKKDALHKYGSEHDRMNRLFETIIEKNHIWGYANEVEYAEGFRVIKMIDN